MTRLLVLCLSVTLVTACKKKENEAAPPAAPAAAAQPSNDTAGMPEGEGDAPVPDEAAQEEKLELKASMVEPYVTYRKAAIAAALSATEKMAQAEKKKGDGTLDTAKFMSEAAAITEELEKKTEEARKQSGLTENQLEALTDVATQVQIARMAKRNDPSAELEKQMQAGAAGATPEQLAEAKAAMESMKKDMKAMTDAADARKEFGDEVVDAMFARGEELEKLLSDSAKALEGK